MSSARPAFPGLSWSSFRALGATRTAAGFTQTTLERDPMHETTLGHWPLGTKSDVHGHDGAETWLYVVSGEVEEERWTKVGTDWSYEVKKVAAGESSALPKDALHRVRALADAVVLTTYTPAPGGAAERVPWSLLPALRAARWRAGFATDD